jgi:hypothetical protein
MVTNTPDWEDEGFVMGSSAESPRLRARLGVNLQGS